MVVSDFTKSSDTIDEIFIYKEHYVNCTMKSRPEYTTGLYPDALLPKVDMYYGETRSTFPFAVTNGNIQGVWVDIGTDANTVAGTYTGTATVSASGKDDIVLNISIEVYNFALPSTSTFPYFFVLNVGNLRYGHQLTTTEDKRELERIYGLSHLYHRVVPKQSNSTDYYTYTWSSPTLTLDNTSTLDGIYEDFLDGTAITSGTYSGAKYPVFVASLTSGLWGVDTNGSIAAGDKQTAARQYIQQVYDHFDTEGWDPFTTLYTEAYDEPRCDTDISFRGSSTNECDVVRAQATDTRSVNTDGAGIFDNTFIHTHNCRTGITDYEDYGFYSPNSYSPVCNGWDRDCSEDGTYCDKDGYNKEYWPYLACDNNGCTGNTETVSEAYNGQIDMSVDADPMYNRSVSFYMRKYGGSGSYYWATLLNYEEGTADPYADMHAFGSNGDGALLYPGIVSKSGRTWNGADHANTPVIGGTHDIPIDSMRWKYIRDWSEDMEYMTLADTAGESASVNTYTDTMFTDTDILDAYWNLNLDEDDLFTARDNVADLILSSQPTITSITAAGVRIN